MQLRRHKRAKLSGQDASPLFTRLPAEVRAEIYRHSILELGQVVHVTAERSDEVLKLRSHSCPIRVTDNEDAIERQQVENDIFSSLDHWQCEHEAEAPSESVELPKLRSVVALMQTCRRVKSEIEGLLYSTLVFKISYSYEGGALPRFFETISPMALDSIQQVMLEVSPVTFRYTTSAKDNEYNLKPTDFDLELHRRWSATKHRLQTLRNLKATRINIYNDNFLFFDEARILQRLQDLHLQRLTVQLPWAGYYSMYTALESDDGYDFSIVRPLGRTNAVKEIARSSGCQRVPEPQTESLARTRGFTVGRPFKLVRRLKKKYS